MLFDLPVELGLERASGRGSEDRFENETMAFLRRARQAYLERARAFADRFVVIDASQDQEAVWEMVREALRRRMNR